MFTKKSYSIRTSFVLRREMERIMYTDSHPIRAAETQRKTRKQGKPMMELRESAVSPLPCKIGFDYGGDK